MKAKLLFVAILFSCFSWGQSLIISQYTETNTGATPKGIEVFNITNTAIVLSTSNNLQVFQGTNGAALASVVNITSGTIPANGVWVIGTSDLTTFVGGSQITTFTFVFNGDDALQIRLGGVSQDTFGTPGVDPGSSWAGSSISTADQNLQIKPLICTGSSGFTDPSLRFTSLGLGSTTTGFGVAPTSCSSPAPSITTSTPITGSPFCVTPTTTASVSVPYSISEIFNAGNIFTAQLSDTLGNFTSPISLGTSTSTTAGTITGTIPANTPTGTGYKIRVIGSDPSTTGSESAAFTINLASATIAPVATQTIGVSVNGVTLTATENPAGTSRQWFYGTSAAGPYDNLISGATATTYIPNFATASTYYVVCTTTSTCGTVTSNVVQVNVTLPSPEINVKGVIASNPSIADGTTTVSGLNNTAFTSVLIGSNQAKVFRIENTGILALNVTAINFVGGQAGDFAVSGIVLPASIAAGTFQDFTVTFSPTAVGTRSTTINISSDDADEATYDFALQGTGITTTLVDINLKGNAVSIPDNSLFPTGLNFTAFGVGIIGSTTVTRTFTIENLGTTDLTLTGVPFVTISGFNASSFSVSVQPSSNTIAGGNSLTFSVLFNPTTLGSKNATINILSNDGDETLYNFNINGTAKGTNNIYVFGNFNTIIKGTTSTSLTNDTNFGSVSITGGIKQNTFTITNLSGSDKNISGLTITGLDAGLFTIISFPTTNALVNGNSTTFTINFAPTTLGVKNATVTFNSTDLTDPVFTYSISGIGESFIPCTNGLIQTIAIQDFEVVPATPTWNYTNDTNGGTVTTNFGGNLSGLASSIGAQALRFNGIGVTGSAFETNVINLDPINTSQYTNVNMSFKVAALTTAGNGLDVVDYVLIETSVDGGINWSTEAQLSGFSNSLWSINATGVFNAFYSGNNNGVTVDTRPGNATLPAGLATYNLKNLPSSANLLIRITLALDRSDEVWAIDNIKIEGQIPVTSTWDGLTWSPATPTSSTKAIIDGNYSTGTNGNFETCECQIKSGKVLDINTGALVTSNPCIEIQSNLFNEGIINIENNASLIQINNSASNVGAGTTNVTRTTPNFDKFDYTYWSSPIKDDNLGAKFSNWNSDFMFTFNTENYSDTSNDASYPQTNGSGSDTFDDNADDWIKITSPATTTMNPGKGYAIMGGISGTFPRPETVTFSGAVNNGIIPFALKQSANTTETGDDFNLVGNPYPSSIKADDFINANILPLGTANNISGTLYFWTHGGNLQPALTNPGPNANNYNANEYALYNLTGSIVTASPAGNAGNPISPAPNGFIGTGQGFFVEAETTNDLIFSNSMRNKLHTNNQFFRNTNPTNENLANEKDRIWLNFENIDNMFSQQLIGYIPNSTLEYDYGYDGKENKTQNYVSFYSFMNNQSSVLYKIQSRATFNENDQIQLGFFSAVSGQTKISIDRAEGILNQTSTNVFLQDNLLNITHDLKQAPYTFTTNYGTFNDRFVLKYLNISLSNTTFVNNENQVLVTTKDTKINVSSNIKNIKSIQIFDILGRNIYTNQSVNDKTLTIDNLTAKNQTLIVKIKLENGEIITRKIII